MIMCTPQCPAACCCLNIQKRLDHFEKLVKRYFTVFVGISMVHHCVERVFVNVQLKHVPHRVLELTSINLDKMQHKTSGETHIGNATQLVVC